MKKINFRFFLMLGGVLALFTTLFVRLVDVQLVRGEQFLAQAEDNRFFQINRPADRGVILDRFGKKIVWNKRVYGLIEDPTVLYSDVTPLENSQALQVMATDSARVQALSSREYSYPEALAHVIGYIGPVTADELEGNADLRPHHFAGKLGIEKWFDSSLRGVDGLDTYEIDAKASRQRLVSETAPETGQTLQTTLDMELSEVAYHALGDQKGSVVILDARTGDVLSLVSKPSFNPEIFNQVLIDKEEIVEKQKQLNQLTQSEDNPFFNRAVAGTYPPGSVFKVVTALASLEKGAVDLNTTVIDEGVLKVGEYEYGNWYFTQYGQTEGEIGLIRAIARSNDIFFYKAAEWVGPNALAEMARLLGFGQATSLELGSQAAGLVPDPAWKEEVIGERWFLGNTYHFGIGQGDILVSPLQVAKSIQPLANDGVQCQPSFMSEGIGRCSSLGLSEDHIDTVLRGMIEACSSGGTAFPFFPVNEERLPTEGDVTVNQALARGVVACKTGTAEFGGVDERGYRKTHGWWAGIVEPQLDSGDEVEAESEETGDSEVGGNYPRRLVIVVLAESDKEVPFKEGSKEAAPVGKAILDWLEAGRPTPEATSSAEIEEVES